ncbi:hypothetical protein PDL71_01275 [Lacibacter sp. MH-610]|uniref:hypothetical protein n=1 Tax=Lacibacter sp. MH-610 TaxID=3020883 RepID=UPI0038913BB4
MTLKKIHSISGLTISFFIALHLFNHCFSISGADKHLAVMKTLRVFYRNIFTETLLVSSAAIQIFSGLKLFVIKRQTAKSFFEKLQIWTGLYLSFFFLIHLSAVLTGRFVLHLDTNFYFGAAGLNTFPFNLFFIPYYFFAVVSFFGHISAIHHQRMSRSISVFTPYKQSIVILISGICFALFLIYGLTNKFRGFQIPAAFNILIGK